MPEILRRNPEDEPFICVIHPDQETSDEVLTQALEQIPTADCDAMSIHFADEYKRWLPSYEYGQRSDLLKWLDCDFIVFIEQRGHRRLQHTVPKKDYERHSAYDRLNYVL